MSNKQTVSKEWYIQTQKHKKTKNNKTILTECASDPYKAREKKRAMERSYYLMHTSDILLLQLLSLLQLSPELIFHYTTSKIMENLTDVLDTLDGSR